MNKKIKKVKHFFNLRGKARLPYHCGDLYMGRKITTVWNDDKGLAKRIETQK